MYCEHCQRPLEMRVIEGALQWGCSWCLPAAREVVELASEPKTPPIAQLLLGVAAGALIGPGIVMTLEKAERLLS